MAIVKIRDRKVDVDIEKELREYDWVRPRWTSEKLIAASPFRHDQTPSFFVKLVGEYAGAWADSGAYDQEFASGNLVKLLAFLRNESYEESEDYLLGAYDFEYVGEDIPLILPKLKVEKNKSIILPEGILDKFETDYTYLKRRHIDDETQREAGIKYDPNTKSVVIPWYDLSKRLRSVKYRTLYGKMFWYHRGATPIRELVYGIESVKGTAAVLEEAEIDALSWRTVGIDAIAVGGANFTDKQASIIKRSNISIIYISGDNDKIGRKFIRQAIEKLRGYVELRKLNKSMYPYKDTNEALIAGENIRAWLAESKSVERFRVNIR